MLYVADEEKTAVSEVRPALGFYELLCEAHFGLLVPRSQCPYRTLPSESVSAPSQAIRLVLGLVCMAK